MSTRIARLRSHPLFWPVLLCIVASALSFAALRLNSGTAALQARIAAVLAETASLAPDLKALHDYEVRRINILDRLETSPPRLNPEQRFPYGSRQPSVTKAERVLPISGLHIRTTEINYRNMEPMLIGNAMAAAISDGHRVTAIEMAPGQGGRLVRASIRFLTFLPRPTFAPAEPDIPPVVTPAGGAPRP